MAGTTYRGHLGTAADWNCQCSVCVCAFLHTQPHHDWTRECVQYSTGMHEQFGYLLSGDYHAVGWRLRDHDELEASGTERVVACDCCDPSSLFQMLSSLGYSLFPTVLYNVLLLFRDMLFTRSLLSSLVTIILAAVILAWCLQGDIVSSFSL